MIDNMTDFEIGYDRNECDNLSLAFCKYSEWKVSDFSFEYLKDSLIILNLLKLRR